MPTEKSERGGGPVCPLWDTTQTIKFYKGQSIHILITLNLAIDMNNISSPQIMSFSLLRRYNRICLSIQYTLLLTKANRCIVQYFAVKGQNYLDIRTFIFLPLEKIEDRGLIFSFRHRSRHLTHTTQQHLNRVNRN